jgi:hypothetical protein
MEEVMKGKITLELTAKEAVAMLSSEATPKSLTTKIVKAFRASSITPQGAKAAVVARATTKGLKTKTPKTTTVTKDETAAS